MDEYITTLKVYGNWTKDAPDELKSYLTNLEQPWYLCTPYSKFHLGIHEAYNFAARMSMFLSENGIFNFSPIVNSHTLDNYAKYEENKFSHTFWLTIDFKFIRLCKGLIVCELPGWDESFGIDKEIKFANYLGLSVIHTKYMELPKLPT